MKSNPKIKLALLCGGPSRERGISLNSARSVCDHLESDQIEIVPIYFDYRTRPFQIPRNWLYSNTPSDFDFKLSKGAKPLSFAALGKVLRGCDLAFPAMHGTFGEDGGVQTLLEKIGVPFVGPEAAEIALAYNKADAQRMLAKAGFTTIGSEDLTPKNAAKVIAKFFSKKKTQRAVLKPAAGGSSLGVISVSNANEANAAAKKLFKEFAAKKVVLEPFCKGKEFTVVVLENKNEIPVALLPVEVETDYSGAQIFDFRKKYLPTREAIYHCPPRFADATIAKIQKLAAEVFLLFGLRDFSRFDGWVLPDGKIWFSDLNPISGMEQNSFLFIQAARLGLSHRDVLLLIIEGALARAGKIHSFKREQVTGKREPIHVLFGGDTAERQVSVMSGTNAWLKLRRSEKFNPTPYFLDFKHRVWKLPYALALNHTAEDIADACSQAVKNAKRDERLRTAVLQKLGISAEQLSEPFFTPRFESLDIFLKRTKLLLIGLHGGFGENGELQALCEAHGVRYNGSGPNASKLCMDKALTGQAIGTLESEGIFSAPKVVAQNKALKSLKSEHWNSLWTELSDSLSSDILLVKPNDDGCSAGVAVLHTRSDLATYVNATLRGDARLEAGTLSGQSNLIEMPQHAPRALLFEPFIHTDKVSVANNKLIWKTISEWVEVTVGVIGKHGQMHAFNPSMTVASGSVLSVEEKFQGGTGINITPPPQPFVSKSAVADAKRRIEIVAQVLGLGGYARIDAFMHRKTGELIVIEVNTLPALTPSTVIYHQALAEKVPLNPTQLLERIMELS